ncbi:gamma-glutamylcyclotransferase [Cohaesibacter celericrescens]|uniref:glutathione-specific gamma-glutamylcyclotransferase n=2 Tax=Cohaesibacter celericrescens TaxID=2067669 RepID=A0A2N5XU60_9HYPH|nr:gamma-glutamylcyclotransferase [Cohaesibacter celericrescens]PLW78051.1 gamma-glutamylcyclotransferase [Cohaesibacter celericrescens]
MSDLWVFGYGSLMWRPGFEYEECFVGELQGYHRALCVYSYVHRGTEETPGLVLGLDDGGSSMGMVFRVAAENRDAVLQYLREREQVTMVYLERSGPVTISDEQGNRDGQIVEAVTYVADHQHIQYAGKLPMDEQVRIVSAGHGKAGPNIDYVLNTVDHLRDIEIEDTELFKLAGRLRAPTRFSEHFE